MERFILFCQPWMKNRLILSFRPQLFKSWITLSTGQITIQRISVRETNCAIQWIVLSTSWTTEAWCIIWTRLAKAVVHFRCIKGMTDGLCEHSRACEDCDFFASTSRDKKFPLRAARSLESTTREQRALVIFRLQQSIWKSRFAVIGFSCCGVPAQTI